MPNHTKRSLKILAGMYGLFLLAGCASATRYGGQPVDLTLDAQVSRPVDVYLIPYRDYKQDPTILTDDNRLRQYYRGKAPAQVRIEPYRWVYVIRDQGVISPPRIFKPDDFINGTVYPYKPE
jgi:hypothetical protein